MSIETNPNQDPTLTDLIEAILAEWEQEERAAHDQDSPATTEWTWGEWPDLD